MSEQDKLLQASIVNIIVIALKLRGKLAEIPEKPETLPKKGK